MRNQDVTVLLQAAPLCWTWVSFLFFTQVLGYIVKETSAESSTDTRVSRSRGFIKYACVCMYKRINKYICVFVLPCILVGFIRNKKEGRQRNKSWREGQARRLWLPVNPTPTERHKQTAVIHAAPTHRHNEFRETHGVTFRDVQVACLCVTRTPLCHIQLRKLERPQVLLVSAHICSSVSHAVADGLVELLGGKRR